MAAMSYSSRPVLAVDGTFDVPDVHQLVADEPVAVPVTVNAQFSGEATQELDQVLLELDAGIANVVERVDANAQFDLVGDFSGSMSLSGDLLEHSQLEATQLAPPAEELETVLVELVLTGKAIRNGGTEAEDSISRVVELTAEGTNTYTVDVSAEGTIDIEEG